MKFQIEEIDREFISQLIIIVSGFILAETFVRRLIENSKGLIEWWILPLLAIMFLILAFEIKHKIKKSWIYYLSYLLYPLLIYYIFLVHQGKIGSINYLILTTETLIIYTLLSLLDGLLTKNQKKGDMRRGRK